ncbi:hypothetical protein FRB90_004228 [Tulasnella sp. 427]|nr:hypothetical protein FRB90_004228 [Tulasnella sp. 427]
MSTTGISFLRALLSLLTPGLYIHISKERWRIDHEAISRSTDYYKNPTAFDPERFLKSDPELDPREFVFGFGRRSCPGNELAFRTVWIMAVSVLWAVKLQRVEGDSTPLDEDIDRFNFNFLR